MRNYRDLLAQARAIHLALQHGAISYEEVKRKTEPLLQLVNIKVTQMARKYKVKPRLFKFQDLGRTF